MNQHIMGIVVVAKPRPWEDGATGTRQRLVQYFLVAGTESVHARLLGVWWAGLCGRGIPKEGGGIFCWLLMGRFEEMC